MTIKLTKLEVLAQDIAKGFIGVAGLQATIEANRQSMVKQLKGRKLKTAKAGGAEIIRFKEELEASGKYSEQHIKNTCTTFLKGVNENKPFSFNPYRAKGAKSSEANTISVKLTIKGEPTESEVASMLRDAVNDKKFREAYAQLAAFIVDALDEFDGE